MWDHERKAHTETDGEGNLTEGKISFDTCLGRCRLLQYPHSREAKHYTAPDKAASHKVISEGRGRNLRNWGLNVECEMYSTDLGKKGERWVFFLVCCLRISKLTNFSNSLATVGLNFICLVTWSHRWLVTILTILFKKTKVEEFLSQFKIAI